MNQIRYKNLAARLGVCLLGLLFCGFGQFLITRSTLIGLGAWECFQTGISMKSGIAYGTVVIYVGVCILLIDVIIRGKIGFGTFLNMFLIGTFINMFNGLGFLGYIENPFIAVIVLLIGMLLNAIGTVFYMTPGLGCGPRDTMMVRIGSKFPNINIAVVRYIMEMTVFFIGVFLGAPLGIGSIISILCANYIVKVVFKLFKFDPRDIDQESLADVALRLVKHNAIHG